MKASDAKWQAVYEAAHAAGIKAADAAKPVPMMVGTPVDMVGSMMGGDGGGFDPTKPVYYVAGGVCGFAAVHFPGTSSFAKWAKAKGYARPAYPKGFSISVRHGGQSLEIKEAFAGAFAKVLSEAGISGVYVWSRMD
jgi:hypothetical protein